MAYTSNIYVVAAICGNFWQESTVNPGIWENLTVDAPGYGLGQWTDNPPQVMRRTALFDWLQSNGYSQDSGEGQLKFLVHENLWIPSLITPSNYSTMTDFFNSTSTDLLGLVKEWMYHWEGISDGTETNRYNFAYDLAYNVFPVDDGVRNPWYSSNSYNTIANARSNSLLVKDFLMGTNPIPHEPTEEDIIAIVRWLFKKKGLEGFKIVF